MTTPVTLQTAKTGRLPKGVTPLQTLLAIEGEALDAKDQLALKHIAVNRPRALIKTGHILWVTRRGRDIRIEAISSQALFDKATPFAQWITRQLTARLRTGSLDIASGWEFNSGDENEPFAYPFRHAFYAPFSPDPQRGGLLFTRDHSFEDTEIPIIRRLAQIFGMASMAMKRKTTKRVTIRKRVVLWSGAALLGLTAFIPVPMTTLAPAEIVADTPYMITAPIDGVIDSILVPPNSLVEAGTELIRFVDTSYRNEFILAGQEQSVAEAKLRQASLTSFINDTAKRNIAVIKAEKSLANARQDYARDRLSKTILTAPKAGLAIYSGPAKWTGRHVATGETIIQITDPKRVLLRIDAPLTIGEALQSGARIKLFLDSDPLNPLEAKLSTASYYAQLTPDGHMAYEAFGHLQSSDDHPLPRIGTRGVAKIYGETAPLGFWLLRRPITIMRQFLGV